MFFKKPKRKNLSAEYITELKKYIDSNFEAAEAAVSEDLCCEEAVSAPMPTAAGEPTFAPKKTSAAKA